VCLVLVGSIGVSACIGPFSENIESRYADRRSAGGAIARGWIPEILPDDASDIREVHNMDTNATWCCFSTRHPADVRARAVRLGAVGVLGPVHSGPRETFRDFSWWPESMASATIEALEFSEAPAYSGATPSLVRAGIDGSGKICFYRH
jgi:hypothetical protein